MIVGEGKSFVMVGTEKGGYSLEQGPEIMTDRAEPSTE